MNTPIKEQLKRLDEIEVTYFVYVNMEDEKHNFAQLNENNLKWLIKGYREALLELKKYGQP